MSSRFNNYQIDGSSENDLYGLSEGFGQPGGASGARSIALEAVKEYQVLLSPYDVRQGNFAGLLLNAVTKSGTDELDGSAFYTYRRKFSSYTTNSTYHPVNCASNSAVDSVVPSCVDELTSTSQVSSWIVARLHPVRTSDNPPR